MHYIRVVFVLLLVGAEVHGAPCSTAVKALPGKGRPISITADWWFRTSRADDRFYVTAGRNLIAVPAADLSTAWTTTFRSTLSGGASVWPSDGNDSAHGLYTIIASDGFLHRINAADGTVDWTYDARRSSCPLDHVEGQPRVFVHQYSLSPLNRDLVLFATRQRCDGARSNRVVALDAATGNMVWTASPPGMGGSTAPLTVDYSHNLVYVGSEAGSMSEDTITALSVIDGAQVWGASTPRSVRTPLVTLPSGTVVAADVGGHLALLAPEDGAPRVGVSLMLAANDDSLRDLTTLSGTRLGIFTGYGKLIAVDATSFFSVWNRPADVAVQGATFGELFLFSPYGVEPVAPRPGPRLRRS